MDYTRVSQLIFKGKVGYRGNRNPIKFNLDEKRVNFYLMVDICEKREQSYHITKLLLATQCLRVY